MSPAPRTARTIRLRRLSPDEGLIALLICAMEANGHAAPSEAARAEHIVWSMARFRRRSGVTVGRLIARMKALAATLDAGALLTAACAALPARLRRPAFAVAADVTLVDGRLERDERRFLAAAARCLAIEPAAARSIVDVIRTKNRA